jgi:aerobic-type carbon monoxide dehydrogenase small subunit (CoxS/CutS family)
MPERAGAGRKGCLRVMLVAWVGADNPAGRDPTEGGTLMTAPQGGLATTSDVLVLTVNGEEHRLLGVRDSDTLADVLRDRMGLVGTKIACDEGACGSCTVLIDGAPTLSCMTLAHAVVDKRITTIEGLKCGNRLHPIQEAFIEERGYACGYCTPGIIMTTKALLEENPNPTEEMIKEALAGNLCRCTVYEHIIDAVKTAAVKMQGGE